MGQEAVRRGRKDDSWWGCIFEKLTVITRHVNKAQQKQSWGYGVKQSFYLLHSTPWIYPPKIKCQLILNCHIYVLGREDSRSCPAKDALIIITALEVLIQ